MFLLNGRFNELLRMRRQVTATGLVFTLILLFVATTALISANNLLFLIFAALLSTLLVSNFISRLSLAGLELDFQFPEHISARRTYRAKVFVRNVKRWMPSFSVSVSGSGDSALSSPLYFPMLPGGATVEETVDVYFGRRGLHREEVFQFSTSFPFGFLKRRARVTLRREALVYPCLNPQPGFEEVLGAISGELEAHYRGRGHDFYRIRPYEAFESARHVDWKATAHTGALQVREFLREQEPLVEIFLDLDVPRSQRDWFEHAVECCAFISWNLAQKEARLRFSSQELRVSIPATGDVYTILKYLALVTPKAARPPAEPDEENSFRIVFSAVPQRFAPSGWSQAHFVGPDTLAGFPGGPRRELL
jgi:uncharacterized protein (DUF58 family)